MKQWAVDELIHSKNCISWQICFCPFFYLCKPPNTGMIRAKCWGTNVHPKILGLPLPTPPIFGMDNRQTKNRLDFAKIKNKPTKKLSDFNNSRDQDLCSTSLHSGCRLIKQPTSQCCWPVIGGMRAVAHWWVDLSSGVMAAKLAFPDLVSACWWVGFLPDMATVGFGVSQG